MTSQPIGFIGLGVMGSVMSRRLLETGHELTVYDIDEQAMARSVEQGATAAASAQAVARNVRRIAISVPGPAVWDVCTAEAGLLAGLQPDTVVLDFSSTGPGLTLPLAERVRAAGAEFLDAPVSGGPGAAQRGGLSIMVGGEREAFEQCRDILDLLGRPVYVGPSGSGQTTKLINQAIVGVTFAAVAEAFALGARAGVDVAAAYDAIKDGGASSWVLETGLRPMLQGDFDPGGTVDIHTRDLANALDLAREQQVPVPLTALAHELYVASQALGHGHEAQQAVVKLWETLLDVEVRQS